jgi:hypothetical protein
MRWHVVWISYSALLTAIAVSGCSGTKILTVKQMNLDGNSEYFVCEGGTAAGCRGEREGDIDPAGFQQRAQVVSPPRECQFGVANMDIVLDGATVQRVRYECAQRPLPTGLPPSTEASEPASSTGLPPSSDDAAPALDATAPDDAAAGTGLPPSTEPTP